MTASHTDQGHEGGIGREFEVGAQIEKDEQAPSWLHPRRVGPGRR